MELIQTIQGAIDYMEAHITEPITYADVAKSLYLSGFHFHRMFSMVVGITPAECLRRRRLSLAGEALSAGGGKVLDVALQYGYDSPESFTKAFTRFHGITPSAARRSGAVLRQFNRLSVKILVEGGDSMQYRIEKRDSFSLLAAVRSFPNAVAGDNDNHEIHDFWMECGENGTLNVLKSHATDGALYGVCESVSNDRPDFRYGIAVQNGDEALVPDGLERWTVEAGTWAVFPCIGRDEDNVIGETWEKIFREFLPQSGYEMLDRADLEVYGDTLGEGVFCEIWIPVRKKA